MTRGMTILETLLALALLSAVAAALVSWVSVASGVAAASGSAASWEITARRVLAIIQDDIVSVDHAGTDDRDGRSRGERVTVRSGELRITDRARERTSGGQSVDGEQQVRYALTGDVLQRLHGGSGGSTTDEVLLDRVEAFRVEIVEDETRPERVLNITIVCSVDGRTLTRRYRIPRFEP